MRTIKVSDLRPGLRFDKPVYIDGEKVACVVNIDAADLEIIVTIVSGVPYLWGPSIATLEVWR